MVTALYPGSFDPLTNGHIDIIQRAVKLFDNLVVAIAINVSKTPLFTVAERVEILEEILHPYTSVKITAFDTLLVSYANTIGAKVIIRGLRAVSDFEFEFQMALMNRNLEPDIETVYLMPRARYSFLSSGLVKEVASFKGRVSDLVPELVDRKLKEKFRDKGSSIP